MEKKERFYLKQEPCGCKTWEEAGAKKDCFEEHVEFCQDHDPEFGDDKPARGRETKNDA
jgi:hypothetical protein